VQGMNTTCFGIQARKYKVLEGGGMTFSGEHCGAKRFVVNLSENTCTCDVPQLIHVPCPHIIVGYNSLIAIAILFNSLYTIEAHMSLTQVSPPCQ
jgi:hypothetical protein